MKPQAVSFDPCDGAGVSQADVIPKEAESPRTFPLHNGNNLIGQEGHTGAAAAGLGPEESLVLDITHHYAFCC